MWDAVAAEVGAAREIRHDGDAWRTPLDALERGSEPFGGGRHQRSVKGGADVEGNDPLRACGLKTLGRRLETLGGAGHDGLSGRVVVGGPGVVHPGEGGLDGLRVEAEDRG